MRKLLLFLLLVLLLYIFIGGDYGLYRIYHLRRRTRELEAENAKLLEEHKRLVEERRKLEGDLGYIEKLAREKYGMIKKGEIVYEIVPGKGRRE